MKFHELSENDRIQNVKDLFYTKLQELAEGTTKIDEYIKVPAKPTGVEETITDSMSEVEKEKVKAKNAELAKAMEEFNKKSEQYEKVKKIISGVEPIEGCVCGTCLKINLGLVVPRELEPVIQAAKAQAEKATY